MARSFIQDFDSAFTRQASARNYSNPIQNRRKHKAEERWSLAWLEAQVFEIAPQCAVFSSLDKRSRGNTPKDIVGILVAKDSHRGSLGGRRGRDDDKENAVQAK